MVFDIRGRRKYAVKVVYGVLAVLMGASLFLVVGPLNIGELFNGNGSSSTAAAKQFEEQAERLEVKLRKSPEDPGLLQALARARATAGNSMVSQASGSEELTQAHQQYQQASAAWTDYLKATDEPNAGVAQLMVSALIFLTEGSRSSAEAKNNLAAAIEAQEIIAKQRPSLNSLSTLALYSYFAGDFAAAEKAKKEAEKFAVGKAEREELDKQLKEGKERAVKYRQQVKAAEKAEKAAAKTGNPESLENPSSPFGGALGGSGLGE